MVQPNMRIITVAGTTATGKTSFSLDLAEAFDLEIVNCDASQFYVGMDIGTAKPTPAEIARAPHHLFDIAAPDAPLDVGRYIELADEAIAGITARGRTALVVGGTGLYHRALLHGLADIPKVTQATRNQLQSRLESLGVEALQKELSVVDPESAARIARNDPQRTTRALEVFYETGVPLSHYQQEHRFAPRRYTACKLGVRLHRDVLRERMRKRVRQMFDAGFADEVQRLVAEGYSLDLRTFKALGYRDVFEFANGHITREEAEERVFHLHWQYSRRQRTWFRKDKEILWVTPSLPQPAHAAVTAFLSHGPSSSI